MLVLNNCQFNLDEKLFYNLRELYGTMMNIVKEGDIDTKKIL
jgi:hypothetical protein